MSPQALRIIPAPAHAQEITAYKTEQDRTLGTRVNFFAVILPSSKSPGQMQEEAGNGPVSLH